MNLQERSTDKKEQNLHLQYQVASSCGFLSAWCAQVARGKTKTPKHKFLWKITQPRNNMCEREANLQRMCLVKGALASLWMFYPLFPKWSADTKSHKIEELEFIDSTISEQKLVCQVQSSFVVVSGDSR